MRIGDIYEWYFLMRKSEKIHEADRIDQGFYIRFSQYLIIIPIYSQLISYFPS